jgi:hypothetical protein
VPGTGTREDGLDGALGKESGGTYRKDGQDRALATCRSLAVVLIKFPAQFDSPSIPLEYLHSRTVARRSTSRIDKLRVDSSFAVGAGTPFYQVVLLVEPRLPSLSRSGRGQGTRMAAPYWEYLRWAGYVVAVIGGWRYLPLGVIRLVAAFTHDEQRHRRCMEVLRLARRDASSIPSYVPTNNASPAQVSPTKLCRAVADFWDPIQHSRSHPLATA